MNKESISVKTILCGVVLVFLAMAAVVSAQEFRGTVTGTVTDPNGAAVPNVTVVLKNTGTNTTVTVTTNDEGGYVVPLLQPGIYSVTAKGTGFKTSIRENVQVKVDDRIAVDIQLEIGTAAEVNIVADTELIERGSVTAGTSVSTRQVEELPLAEGSAVRARDTGSGRGLYG